jgi:hypothetical protein
MPQQFSNNARSTLASTISNTATSLTVQSGAADLFPTANVGSGSLPSVDNWFKATLQDVSGNVEIIYVRTRNGGSAVFSNILRAQEGTTAREFVAGSVVGLRVTAADIQASINLPGADTTYAGSNTFLQAINADSGIDYGGNFATLVDDEKLSIQYNGTTVATVNSTGTIDGDLSGNVTGNVTGKLFAGDFTVEESDGKLLFKNGTTPIASLSAAGDLIVAGDITAFGDLEP